MHKGFTLAEEVVRVQVDVPDREAIISLLADVLEKEGYVKETYKEAVLAREEVFSTGLPLQEYCVAIPHTDAIHVNKPMIGVATLKNPVQFAEMGNPEELLDVKLVFMLAMQDGRDQIKLLTQMMKIVQDQELLNRIYQADQKEIVELINQKLCME